MRIAHLSDLHVLDLAGVKPHHFLNKRLTGYVNIALKRGHVHREPHVRALTREIGRARVDHVVVTGDLTNLALASEYDAVRRLFEDEMHLSAKDVSVVPGNHDVYTRGAMRAGRFAAHFGAYLESDLPEFGVDLGVGRFPFVKLRGPAAIIGLSSAVPRPPFVAAGRLGNAQLEALAGVLAHPEVTSRTPVVLLHHPAHNPRSALKALLEGLDDAAGLCSTMQSVARGLLVHGHLHRRLERALPTERGSVRAIGATSASLEHEDPNKMAGFNLYELTDAGEIVTVEAHVLDPRSGAFSITKVPLVS